MSTPRPPVLAGWIVADLAVTFEVALFAALFVGALGLGVAVFVWLRNWRRELVVEPTTEEQLQSYQHMLDQGLIDQQEYQRIAAQLHTQPPVQSEGLAAPPPPSGPTPEPPSECNP